MFTERYSPEQVACRLRLEHPENVESVEMQVSHETIHQALYVEGRGSLRLEIATALRSGHARRRPQKPDSPRPGRLQGMVIISDRPPEIEDRAIPGHWEGDLIIGSTSTRSAIGTLVERTSGFVMLLHLPGDHTALTVSTAMIKAMNTLPEQLRRSVTWDQGREMAKHQEITMATGMPIYFCDPHSPWQRGSNENTNGLLRQYFPKSTDLSFHGPGILNNVATELNARPGKRHGYRTPAEVLAEILSNQTSQNGVATTT
jgi:IS30 family transposase